MSGSDEVPPRTVGVLSEVTVRRDPTHHTSTDENPYWLAEEPNPHPNPELGCIRRGLCCKSSPGWFGPGEVEEAAASVGLSSEEFVKKYIIIDWIEVDGEKIEVFAPVKLGTDGAPVYPTARRVDRLYQMLRGTCIFYKNGGCQIYKARPLECRTYDCTNVPEDNMSHRDIARLWRDGPAKED